MKLVNLTGHPVNLNDGKVFTEAMDSNGKMMIARVDASFTEPDENQIMNQTFGDITGLPEPVDGTIYIVSAIVLAAGKKEGRTDLVAPATGHPGCLRHDGVTGPKGAPKSVPGFVR